MNRFAYTDFLKRFGAAVKARRQALDKSQEDLAFELGIHQSNISKLENGEQGFDSTTLFKLGRALGTHLHRLLKKAKA